MLAVLGYCVVGAGVAFAIIAQLAPDQPKRRGASIPPQEAPSHKETKQ